MDYHTSIGSDHVMNPLRMLGALAFCATVVVSACESTGLGTEPIQCLVDGNCPPACKCEGADFDLVGKCENPANQVECGGTCDAQTACPAGTECLLSSSTDSLEIYACITPGGTGGTGGGGGAGGTGGAGATGGRTIIDRCEESTEVYCNNGYDCRESGWSVSDEVFEQLYGQSLTECLDFGTPCTTEEAYCSDQGLPGTYSADNHEACIAGQQSSNCEVDEFGLPVLPLVCDQLCVEE